MEVQLEPLIIAAAQKRMNLYEKHIWNEILEWEYENNEGLWNYCSTVTSNAIRTAIEKTGSVVPERVTNTLKAAIESTLRACLSGGLYSTSKAQVLDGAKALFKREFTDISQLKELGLEQLDELAGNYASTSQIFALLEGAGMGLGGLLFIAADIPTLITINFRLLVQLAYIYGIDANDPRERQYLMNVMTLASAEQKERHDIFCRLDQQAKINAQLAIAAIQIQENIVNEILQHAVGAAHRIAIRLTHAKLLQLLPLLGLAIGAGSNYAFTKEVTVFATKLFSKRWLMEKYSLFDEVLEYRSDHLDRLMGSWVLTPSDGDDMEFEEDFRVATTSNPFSIDYTDVDADSPPRPSSPLYPALALNPTPPNVSTSPRTNTTTLPNALNGAANGGPAKIPSPHNPPPPHPNTNGFKFIASYIGSNAASKDTNTTTTTISTNNNNTTNNNTASTNNNKNNNYNKNNGTNPSFSPPNNPNTLTFSPPFPPSNPNNNGNNNNNGVESGNASNKSNVYANANFYKALLSANNPAAFSGTQ